MFRSDQTDAGGSATGQGALKCAAWSRDDEGEEEGS